MKFKNLSIILGLMCFLLLGCATHREIRKEDITTYPVPYVITADSLRQATVEVDFHIPAHYLAKRSRLLIVPQLMQEDSLVEEFMPLVIDAPIFHQKMTRRQRLTNYRDPYEGNKQKVTQWKRSSQWHYATRITLPQPADSCRLTAVVTTDGCGHCSGLDTLEVAWIKPLPPVVDTFSVNWIEPVYTPRPKIIKGQGVARLQFIINRYDINLQLGNNRQELNQMTTTLKRILTDSLATLTQLDIYGMASADGSYGFNKVLAQNRANSAKEWVMKEMPMTPANQQLIRTGSRPEGWQPVLEAMIADGHPDSTLVKNILNRYAAGNDDVQERHIRRLSAWRTIRDRYLQKDRKIEYTYAYTLRSFTTDEELLSMYGKRPDAFSLEEFFRVASLTNSYHEKSRVYETILNYYPESVTTLNNLAFLYWKLGRTAEAKELMNRITPKTVAP